MLNKYVFKFKKVIITKMAYTFKSLLVLCVIYVVVILTDNVKAKRVTIEVYYETHCPHCIKFFKNQVGPVVEKYASRINIHTIPFGNGETYEENGEIKVQCQHGEIECYGNKLHACAIHEIRNNTKTALFNTCMMTGSREYDAINDLLATCGSKLNITTDGIKECALSQRGFDLLLRYAARTYKQHVNSVPYVTFNGRHFSGRLERNLCGFLEPMPNDCFKKYGPIHGLNLYQRY